MGWEFIARSQGESWLGKTMLVGLIGLWGLSAAPLAAAEHGSASAVTTSIKPCVVLTGSNSSISERGYYRILSVKQWAELWQRHIGQKELIADDDQALEALEALDFAGLPLIDFDHFMVIGIFQGSGWNSAGLRAISIAKSADHLVLRFRDKSYQSEGEGHRVTVYGFFVVPRSTKALVVEEDVNDLIGKQPIWKQRITFPKTEMQQAPSTDIR